MKIILIDSGGANISSVVFALERLGQKPLLTDDIDQITTAEKIILPGVGSAENSMRILQEKGLIECIKNLQQPLLGICLGMQLLFDRSEEGDVDCLGIIPGSVKQIPPKEGFTIPHMGWNSLNKVKDDLLLKNIKDKSYAYFVHSFYVPTTKYTLAVTDYIVSIAAIVNKDNFYGCQFHPEKSGRVGAQILQNFLEL